MEPGTQLMAASLCHPPRYRSATRRRLAPASARLPPPGLGCPPRDAPSQCEDREAREEEGSQRGRPRPETLPQSSAEGSRLSSGSWALVPPHFPLTFQLSLLGCTLRTPRSAEGPQQRGLGGVFRRDGRSLNPIPTTDRSQRRPGAGFSPFPRFHLRLGERGGEQAQAGFWWEPPPSSP